MGQFKSVSAMFRKDPNVVTDNQHRLILLICIPCFTVTAISLFLAQISFYLIVFILIILALICTYVAVANQKNSQYQIRTLSNLIESMNDGDYTLRGRTQTNPAYQELLDLINHLAETLSKHKIEAKQSRLLLERIMEQMDAMVLATNEQGNVVLANTSANKLLLGGVDNFYHIKLAETAIGKIITYATSGVITFNQHNLPGEHFLFTEAFLSEGQTHQLYLITNAERLLMEKERKAWQSLLRVLSHELNNSLTPIATISQSMQSRLKQSGGAFNADSLIEGVSIINERADSLSNFIARYSQLTHLPQPVIASFDLPTMVNKLASLFPDCKIDYKGQVSLINADKHQLEQVFINLFKNAREAMLPSQISIEQPKDGNRQNEKTTSDTNTLINNMRIEVHVEQQGKKTQISVVDQGKGIANLDNVFVPFYTTKPQSSGIGLALCRQILFNHNGTLTLANNENEQGVKVTMVIAT